MLLESQIEDQKLRETYHKKKADSIFNNLNRNVNNINFEIQFEAEVKNIGDN